jgi:ammonium transporter
LPGRLETLLPRELDGLNIRHHGDLHLGQMLIVKDDIFIVDFAGEPRRTIAERRRKAPAARDIASLVRSIDYSATAALERALKVAHDEHGKLGAALSEWRDRATAAFLAAYYEAMTDQRLWPADPNAADGLLAFFLFEMVFMDTAATIPTGAMAERWKFSAFIVFGFFMSMVVYPLFGNWVWGGGWLATLGKEFGLGHGHVDFAGSSVVHMVGGVAALAGAIVIGPRLGKYTKSGESVAIPGHDIPMAIAGTFILAFGWFGFNPGSTLAGGDLRIAVVATNTMLAGTGGALAACFWVWKRLGKPDPAMIVNGLLAGLVAITAPCAFVNSASAVVIGALAGLIVVESVLFIDRVLRIDDPVGAISVHGVCGAFGTLCVGIFADGTYGDGWNGVPGTVKGLLYGDASQLAAEAIGVATCFVFVFAMFFVFFKVVEATMGNRVSAEAEIEGLDIPEMGASAYPDFVLGPGTPLGGGMTLASSGTAAQPALQPIRGDA